MRCRAGRGRAPGRPACTPGPPRGRAPTAGPRVRLVFAGDPLPAEAVVSLPRLRGPYLPGLPHDGDGFIPVDAHGYVGNELDVYAAGDATTCPIKQGGIAAQLADAAAEAIEALRRAATLSGRSPSASVGSDPTRCRSTSCPSASTASPSASSRVTQVCPSTSSRPAWAGTFSVPKATRRPSGEKVGIPAVAVPGIARACS